VLIEENGCSIFYLHMITNKALPLIAWKLVLFVICVCWVLVWMFIVFFIFLVFDLFLCFFYICFWFNCLFWFSFGSNHGFRFESGLNQFFRVNLIRFGLDQVLRHCLVGYFFYWRIFGLKYCITNTLLDLFWQFCFE